ncbi:hypothetical protein JOM56_011792 [Amanita muscaria]
MPNLHDLPADILRDIFSACEPRALTETCHYFSTIVYSLPQFSNIYIGPRQLDPHLLRSRLGRISTSLLVVSIGPIEADIVESTLVESICTLLAELNSEINQLEISAETASAAGSLLSSIFSGFAKPAMTFPKLQRLSVQVKLEYFGDYTPAWPQLDLVLEHAAENFPELQILSLSDFFECIPALHGTPPFSNLHTLILDGSCAGQGMCARPIIGLLHNTPILETLWIKHPIGLHSILVSGSELKSPVVVLSCLASLTVSSPGSSELLHYIVAPALRDLHVDASKDPYSWDDGFSFWTNMGIRAMANALSSLARWSTNLRRLAITALYLREEVWNWLMFSGPPFPRLESLAIHGLKSTLEDSQVECAFNDSLLLRCSEYQGPMVSLHRLAVLNCDLPLTGSVLIKALMSRLNGSPKEGFELELDDKGPQFSEEEVGTLAQVGVKLIRRTEGEVKEDEWWKHGHGIDPSDAHAY